MFKQIIVMDVHNYRVGGCLQISGGDGEVGKWRVVCFSFCRGESGLTFFLGGGEQRRVFSAFHRPEFRLRPLSAGFIKQTFTNYSFVCVSLLQPAARSHSAGSSA